MSSADRSASTRPPSWVEVRVVVPSGWEELVAEELMLDGCTSVAVGRPNLGVPPAPAGSEYLRTFYAARDDSEDLRTSIRARLEGLAERADVPELENLTPEFKPLPHEDWATSWKKVWRPFRVGRLAIVTHDWSAPLRDEDIPFRLEPGGAFGTGRHATTRMCLRALQELDLSQARILDAGSGSGILSIASALLGAPAVLGFDIDPRAEAEGNELASDNHVADRCTFRTGDFSVLDDRDRDFDLVLGNIYSDVLQQHAAELHARLRPGGRFLLSGCPDRHAEPTLAAFDAAGLRVEETRQRGRWLAFIGERSPSLR
ncbi:MAG: 50S ribosomal protein L11 methyltransferase [Planctomycetota bacterium]